MSAARVREGTFGRVRARLTGAEDLFLERVPHAIDTEDDEHRPRLDALDAQDLADRPRVDILGAFEVAAIDADGGATVDADADEPAGQAAILVEVEGDPSLILALVWRAHHVTAVASNDDRDGVVFFAFEHVTVGTLIRIVECDSEADATTWLEQLGSEQPPTATEPPVHEEPPTSGPSETWLEEIPPTIPPDDTFFEPETGGLGVAPAERPRPVPGIAPPTPSVAPVPKPIPARPVPPGPVLGVAPGPDDGAGAAAAPTPVGGDAAAAPDEGGAAPAPDDEGGAAASVPAHVSGEMPGTTVAGQIAIVEATLSRDRVTPAAGAAFAEAPVKVIEDTPVLVSIATRGYRLVSGARRVRSLRLKKGHAKNVVRFAVEAIDPGTAEVTLVFRQNDELPLATLRLVSQITTQPAAATPVKRAADLVPPEPDVLSMPTLRIDESVASGDSFLDVAVQIGRRHVEGRVKVVGKSQLVSDTYEQITDLREARKAARRAAEEGDEPDLPTLRRIALEQLRKIGVDLSLRLFTRDVRQFLWDHVDELDHLVIQTTGELDIPWEIIYVSDPATSVDEEPEVVVDHFLGMRGSTRLVYSTALPREVVVQHRRARYLCPSYTGRGLGLAFTEEEVKLVREALRAAVVRPGTAEAMSQLMTAGFDLLHFAGHGIWSTTPPDQRLLLASYRKEKPTKPNTAYSAATLRRDLPDRATAAADVAAATDVTVKMVFLNACDVGRTDASVVGLGGFPEAFLRGGVGVLLGCSWAIDDEIGSTFSRHFYQALKTSDIADAMREARIRSLEDDDLSALAYVAYAHPHARVTVA